MSSDVNFRVLLHDTSNVVETDKHQDHLLVEVSTGDSPEISVYDDVDNDGAFEKDERFTGKEAMAKLSAMLGKQGAIKLTAGLKLPVIGENMRSINVRTEDNGRQVKRISLDRAAYRDSDDKALKGDGLSVHTYEEQQNLMKRLLDTSANPLGLERLKPESLTVRALSDLVGVLGIEISMLKEDILDSAYMPRFSNDPNKVRAANEAYEARQADLEEKSKRIEDVQGELLDTLVEKGWHKNLDKLAGSAMSADQQIIMFMKGGDDIIKTASPESLSRWIKKVLSSDADPRLEQALAKYIVNAELSLTDGVFSSQVRPASQFMRKVPGNIILPALPEAWLTKNKIELPSPGPTHILY